MRLKLEGLSHGLKNSPPDCFLRQRSCRRPFESLPAHKQKSGNTVRHFLIFGTPEGTRTPDLLIRSQSLYPTELPAHTFTERLDIIAQWVLLVKRFLKKQEKIFLCRRRQKSIDFFVPICYNRANAGLVHR